VGTTRDPIEVVNRIGDAVQQVLEEADCLDLHPPIGIGFAGMMRGRTGVVANAPQFSWNDVDLGALVRERFGPRHHILLINDVDAVTLGECTFGAAAGARDALAVYVGTGIGGGVMAGGKLIDGAGNCAGEIGHTKVVWTENARVCACGSRGCVEAYVGGRNLERRARGELRGGARSVATRLAGSPDRVDAGHLDQAAAQGDSYVLALYAEIAPLLGVALANAVTLLNPSHLILGGGVLARAPILKEHVIMAFEVAVNNPALEELEIVDAALGDDAGVVGSALLASLVD
jgi:glucokinase